jgi:5-methylcytosine-specific restriction protein A
MPADPFYRSAEWHRARALALRRDGKLCQACGDTASHVDHIVARAAGGASLDLANLRSLCAGCHSRKTARADGGFGNRKGAAVWGCDEAGLPLDPAHAWRRGGGA